MNKYWIGAVVIVILLGTGIYFQNKNVSVTDQTPPPSPTSSPTPTESSDIITPMDQENELVIEDIKVGSGLEAVSGKKVTVNYKGTLKDGTEFDSSYKRNQPFSFNLGAGEVIQGWDKGFSGMKVGGRRKLTIPPSLGYGDRQVGSIPANSILIFEVELLKVE